MMFSSVLFFVFALSFPLITAWDATWESLDSRPLPTWYDEAKFGIFIHWGVFSVPSFGSEWFWNFWKDSSQRGDSYEEFVNKTELPKFTYQEYASRFDASLYEPTKWAQVFADSGAQYVALTSKHHEGFCNWDSRSIPTTWNWNALDIGPHRDILGDLSAAVKSTTSPHTNRSLKFGVYHSLFEWYNPAYIYDKSTNFTTNTFVTSKTLPELYDLVEQYDPELIWSDGEWDAPSEYWKSTEFLSWYATNSSVSSTAVWNDRWGRDATCHHGGYLTCADHYQPGKLVSRKWENAMTIDSTSWGFNRNSSLSDYHTTYELLHELISTVAFNGNLLLNVGPSHDGTISPIFMDRLSEMGEWLGVNGESIYHTRPYDVCQNETAVNVYYTTRPAMNTLYAILVKWPASNLLTLSCVKTTPQTKVTMLGYDESEIEWSHDGEMTTMIQLPALTPDLIPCQHAWVLKLTGVDGVGSIEDDENLLHEHAFESRRLRM